MSITNFHIDLTQLPSEEHLKYLQKLPKHQKSRVLAALAGPEDQIKTTLLNDKIARPGRVLAKEELFIALQDCYQSICLNRFEVAYAIAIVDALTDRASTRSKWAQEAAEQVIFLAARLIKGEGCEDHSDYESPSRMWAGVHKDFADAIANLEDVGRKQGVWIYSDKARFCLGKLSSGYPSQYLLIQTFGAARNGPTTNELQEELDEMWCHDNENCENCSCWDHGYKSWQGHAKPCSLYAL